MRNPSLFTLFLCSVPENSKKGESEKLRYQNFKQYCQNPETIFKTYVILRKLIKYTFFYYIFNGYSSLYQPNVSLKTF